VDNGQWRVESGEWTRDGRRRTVCFFVVIPAEAGIQRIGLIRLIRPMKEKGGVGWTQTFKKRPIPTQTHSFIDCLLGLM